MPFHVGPSQYFEICWPLILSSPQEDKMSCIVKEWSAFVRGNCKKSLEFCQEAGAASLDGSNPLLMVDDPDFPKGRKPLWFPHKELISSIFRTIAPHLTHTSQRRLVAHKSITSDSCKSTICRLNKSWIHGHRQIATIYLWSKKWIRYILDFKEVSRIFIHCTFVRLSRIIKFFCPLSRGWLLTGWWVCLARIVPSCPRPSCQIESDPGFLLPEELFISLRNPTGSDAKNAMKEFW